MCSRQRNDAPLETKKLKSGEISSPLSIESDLLRRSGGTKSASSPCRVSHRRVTFNFQGIGRYLQRSSKTLTTCTSVAFVRAFARAIRSLSLPPVMLLLPPVLLESNAEVTARRLLPAVLGRAFDCSTGTFDLSFPSPLLLVVDTVAVDPDLSVSRLLSL